MDAGLTAIGAGLAVGLAAIGTGLAQATHWFSRGRRDRRKARSAWHDHLVGCHSGDHGDLGFRGGSHGFVTRRLNVSLEAILQAITASGDAQVSQIEEQTRAQVEEILAGARQEAMKVKTKAYNNAVAPAARERSQILHLAKLEVLHAIGGLRETLVDTALEGAGSRLERYSSTGSLPGGVIKLDTRKLWRRSSYPLENARLLSWKLTPVTGLSWIPSWLR